jgi:flagellar biogenesis protein FliO
MLRSIGTIVIVLVTLGATPIFAQSVGTPGPPAWQDGASAYLVGHGPTPGSGGQAQRTDIIQYNASAQSYPPQLPIVNSTGIDHDVMPAGHTTAVSSEAAEGDRYLAPPSDPTATFGEQPSIAGGEDRRNTRSVLNIGVSSSSLYTVACALTIVIGAFLVCAWLLRRGTTSSTTVLPTDVVSVLGRAPLAARQFAQLLRVGNKLVLVSLSPGGVETITEVTDPAEVDRLAGLCQQSNPHSTTQAFEQTFQQLAQERAPNGFFGSDPLPPALSPPAELGLFRTPRGEAARA